MIRANRKSYPLVALVFFVLVAVMPGCKSNKKVMQASTVEPDKAKMEQEANLKRQQEEAQRREAEERAKREAEARAKEVDAPKVRLASYFVAISSATSVASANSTIAETLSMFASPNTPVFIVISEENGQKDYDRPTNIKDYLNYLKDQKKNINTITSLKVDDAGKITELELLKAL